ncbi:MAG: response regulator [Calditrichaeota bacterium]|nr:response regulator [Calditrichota bacterium]
MRLLLIENDSTHGKVLKDVFSLWGHDVGLCLSAKELSNHLQKSDWNGVVTELAIPGMEKYQVISRVKEEMPWVPVIVLTENGSIKSAVRAIQMGADEFFVKPLEVNQLQAVLGQISRNMRKWEETEYLQSDLKNTSRRMQFQLQKIYRLLERTRKDELKLRFIQRNSLNSISEGLLMLDETGIVYLLNDKMARFLGIPDAGSVNGKNLFQEIPELKATRLFQVFQDFLENQKGLKIDHFTLRDDPRSDCEPVELSIAGSRFNTKDSLFSGVIFIMKKGTGHEC